MSSSDLTVAAGTPLAYESRPSQAQNPFWSVLRFGLIVWSTTILVRHAAYWFMPGVNPSGGTGRAMTLAAIEALVLLAMLVTATFAARGPSRRTLNTLAAISAAYLVVQFATFGFELIDTSARPTRVLWMAATRVQIWVVPIMAIAAAIRTRRVA